MSVSSKLTEGWGWPLNSKKAHYFVGGRALCMKWLFFGDCQMGNDNSPDNCKACVKRLEKEGTKLAKENGA